MMNKSVVQPVSFQKYSNLGSIESTAMFYVPQTGEEQQLVLGQARQFTQNYQQEGTPIPVFELLEYVKKVNFHDDGHIDTGPEVFCTRIVEKSEISFAI